jgi:hypothetical protein
MTIRQAPLGSTVLVSWALSNPSTGGYVPASEISVIEAEAYVGNSGTPITLSAVSTSGAADGTFFVYMTLDTVQYAVNDVVNVFARMTYDGIQYQKVVATILVDPPAITGAVTDGTATASATTFRTDIDEGDLPSTIITPANIWLRSSDFVTLAGSNVTDWQSGGTGNLYSQATSTNQPTLSGGVVVFDGVDNYMTAPNVASNRPTTGWTIAMRITVNSTSGTQGIFGKGDPSTCDWLVQLASNEFRFWAGSSYATGAYKTAFFPSTGTYTIVIVYDGGGSTNADKVKIWLDGVAQTLSFYGTIPATIPNNSLDVGLGALNTGGQPFNGSVTEIYCSTAIADATQVARLTDVLTTQRSDFWKGNLLLFTSGSLTGQVRKITGFSRETRFFSFTDDFSQAPVVGDRVLILAS